MVLQTELSTNSPSSANLLATEGMRRLRERKNIMTQNQIAYQRLLEDMRNNRVVSTETATHNRNTESETALHNRETERQGSVSLTELNRHNLATEKEAVRSNKAREKENKRANTLNYTAQIKKVENDLQIAREQNASKEKIASLEQSLQYWKTQQDNASREKAASISAAANIAAANISASASKYASDIQKYGMDMNKLIADDRNATQKQINTATNLSQQIQTCWKLAEDHWHAKNEFKLKADANKMQLLRDKVDAAYKEKQITLQAYEELRKWFDTGNNQANNAIRTIGSTLKGLGGSLK